MTSSFEQAYIPDIDTIKICKEYFFSFITPEF
jgi:hypothetical protein